MTRMEGKLLYPRSFRMVTRLNRKLCSNKSPLISVVQRFDVDLLHLKHRVHDAFGFRGVLLVQHVNQHSWSDLPRQAEFVFYPTAGRFLSTVSGQFPPEIIHFLLRFAVYDKGDGFIEFELRTAV